jgi:hypothetical protein
MRPMRTVILNAVKDPAPWPRHAFLRILRFAQNDTLRSVRVALFTVFLALSLPLSALRSPAAEVIDLAPDLGYLRVHSIVLEREAIAAALLKSRALVLDLRYPLDERDAGETLRQELASHPAKARLYVLVSPATPVPVVGAIAASPARLTTLGVKGARPEPQVVVLQPPADDRRAFEAHTAGTALADLISGKIDKDRFDEATLVQEFRLGLPGDRSAGQPPGTAAESRPEAAAPAAKAPARVTDRVLQRALHLHRALQALKR